jgi:YD repeat-containing protein
MKYLLVLIFISFSILGYGQINEFNNPQAYSFTKFIDNPVSHYTGKPIINIPLHTIKVDDFDFPISISYNYGGIKVSEEASEVGLGWSLNSYGVIVQVVNGKNDLLESNSPSTYWPIPDAGITHETIVNEHWYNGVLSFELSEPSGNYDNYALIASSFDTKIDIFQYNFGDYSGEFYFNPIKNEFIDKSNNILSIKYENDFFVIIDNKGNRYEFSLSVFNNNNCYGDAGFSFYLKKIITSHKHEISFNYTTTGGLEEELPIITQSLYWGFKGGESFCSASCGPHHQVTPPKGEQISISATNTMPYEIDNIITPYENILFSRSEREDYNYRTKVYQIEVKAKIGSFCKTFDFSYDYFEATDKKGFYSSSYGGFSDSRLNKRLKLTGIALNNKYFRGFDYFEEHQLPNKMSFATDLYGYYNGKSQNNKWLPKMLYFNENMTDSEFIHGLKSASLNFADRRFDEEYAKSGMLKTIFTPLGGSITYTPQPNTYSNGSYELKERSINIGDFNFKDASQTVLNNEETYEFQNTINLYFKLKVKLPFGEHSPTYNMSDCYFKIVNETGNNVVSKNCNSKPGEYEYSEEFFVTLKPGKYKFITNLSDAIESEGYTNHENTYYIEVIGKLYYTTQEGNGCGFRVSKITTLNNNSTEYVKEYKYSNGIMLAKPNFLREFGAYNCYTVCKEAATLDGHILVASGYGYILSSRSHNQHNIKGSYVGYTTVQEIINGQKTEYEYFNAAATTSFAAPMGTPSFILPKNGLQLKIKQYGKDGLPKLVSSFYYTSTKRDYIMNLNVEPHQFIEKQKDYKTTGIFLATFYPTYAYSTNLTYTTIEEKIGGVTIQSLKKFDYNKHNLVNKTSYTNSTGDTYIEETKFSGDFINFKTTNIRTVINDKNLYSYPLQKLSWKNDRLIDGEIFEYKEQNDIVTLHKKYKLQYDPNESLYKDDLNYHMRDGDLIFEEINDTYHPKNQYFKPDVIFDQYDSRGNLLQYHNANDIPISYIWGYNNQYPIAKAENAVAGEIAYTSFEDSGEEYFYAKNYPIYSDNAKTGKKVLKLNTRYPLQSKNLPRKKYIIEFFLSFSAYEAFSINNMNITPKVGYNKKIIDLEELCKDNIYISGSSTISIDEVRIYPADAQMTTYTYDPLIGMTSETDPNGKTTYYEYDSFGRLKYVKDHKGNVIKKHEYKYATEE